MADWLRGYSLKPCMVVVLISMLPLIELRGSIPVGVLLFGMHPLEATLLSIVGNMIPIPLILLFVEGILELISKVKLGKKFTDWLYARTRHKGKKIEKYEAIGLISFVGIPLPGTGGWTGAFAARIFGIPFWRSMLFVFIGVLVAAVLMNIITMFTGWTIG